MGALASSQRRMAAWPTSEQAQKEWLRRFLARELPSLDVTDVTPMVTGFMSRNYRVETKGGERYCLAKASYPKHRAWSYFNSAAAAGLAPKALLQKYDEASGESFEVTEFLHGPEVLASVAYLGISTSHAAPSTELVAKCGRLLARLHGMDRSWHASFASMEAAAAAGIPEVDLASRGVLHDMYDGPKNAMAVHLERLLRGPFEKAMPEDFRAQVGCDLEFLVREALQVFDHLLLPEDGLTARIVCGHGDFHGGNILVHNGSPFAIDFECSYIGPAGWDVAFFYHYLRRLGEDHDYEQTFAFAKAYMSEANGAEPGEADVEDFIFEMLIWSYFVGIKQGGVAIIVKHLVGVPVEASRLRAAYRMVRKEYLVKYAMLLEAAKKDEALRTRFVRTGRVTDEAPPEERAEDAFLKSSGGVVDNLDFCIERILFGIVVVAVIVLAMIARLLLYS